MHVIASLLVTVGGDYFGGQVWPCSRYARRESAQCATGEVEIPIPYAQKTASDCHKTLSWYSADGGDLQQRVFFLGAPPVIYTRCVGSGKPSFVENIQERSRRCDIKVS